MARGKSPPNSAKLNSCRSKLHTSITVQLCPLFSAYMELIGHWNVQKLLPVLRLKNISYLGCQFLFILQILRLDLSVKLGVCFCCTGAGCASVMERKPFMMRDETSESNQAGFKYYYLWSICQFPRTSPTGKKLIQSYLWKVIGIKISIVIMRLIKNFFVMMEKQWFLWWSSTYFLRCDVI